jgi:hypothetical protein
VTLVGIPISIAVLLQALENLKIHKGRARLLALLQLTGSVFCLGFSPLAPVGGVLMLAGVWGIAVHWRGTLNGGSDFMTFHVLAAWTAQLWFPSLTHYAFFYIAIQLILSYTIAGLAKIASSEWREGTALPEILGRYGSAWRPSRFFSWGLMLYELSWPLAYWHPVPYVLTGMLFHLINAYVFGLNRFFWAWLAAYPALLAVAG